MATGRKIKVKGYKLDKKSGTRIVDDPKRLNVSARLKKQGAARIRYGRRGGK